MNDAEFMATLRSRLEDARDQLARAEQELELAQLDAQSWIDQVRSLRIICEIVERELKEGVARGE